MFLHELKGLVKERINDLRKMRNALSKEEQNVLGDMFEGRIYELKYILNCIDNKPNRTICSGKGFDNRIKRSER